MGTAFEAALICDIKPNVSEKTIQTLQYMTRESDYCFDTSIQHDLFLLGKGMHNRGEYLDAWRDIISNTSGNTVEETFFTQARKSYFQDYRLCFRRVTTDDAYQVLGLLIDWIASISDTLGSELVGSRVDIVSHEQLLIYFQEGLAVEKTSSDLDEMPVALVRSINTALGGAGTYT